MSDLVTVRCPGCGRVVAQVAHGSGATKCPKCKQLVRWSVDKRAVVSRA